MVNERVGTVGTVSLASLLIEAIKEAYPNPISSPSSEGWTTKEEYCVGGAICRFTGMMIGFPGPEAIGDALAELGANTHQHDFNHLCYLLTEFNDAEEFDEAWRIAREILEA